MISVLTTDFRAEKSIFDGLLACPSCGKLATCTDVFWLRKLRRALICVSGRHGLIKAAIELHLLEAICSKSVLIHGFYESILLLVLRYDFLGNQGHARLRSHCELSSLPLRQRLCAHYVTFGCRFFHLNEFTLSCRIHKRVHTVD